MAIRFFDMFAGIGGFRSGLEAVGGFECVGHCEIDKYANQAYNAIYEPKGELHFEDARTINPNDLPDIDLICAGFPCQSFSFAGRRLGFADTRGTLFFEIARIAEAKRPAYLLLENVPGLLSHDGGRTFETILSALVKLGYDLEWCVHNSAHFGVPQQRRRLYIVAGLRGRGTGEIFPLACGNAENLKELIPGPQGSRVYETDGVACTQTAGSIMGSPKSCKTFWGEEEQRNERAFRCQAETSDMQLATTRGGKTGLYFIDMNPDPIITDSARCITARQDSGVSNHRGEHSAVLVTDEPRAILTPDREKVRQQGRRVKEPNEPMFTITAQDRHGVWHKGRIRKLMPIECWRLQGFTDEQFNKAAATGLSDGRLYKMAGNAVSVPVISAIGRKIKELYNENYGVKGCDSNGG